MHLEQRHWWKLQGETVVRWCCRDESEPAHHLMDDLTWVVWTHDAPRNHPERYQVEQISAYLYWNEFLKERGHLASLSSIISWTNAALRMAELIFRQPKRRSGDGTIGPGLHSTSPHNRSNVTRRLQTDRNCFGWNGTELNGRLHRRNQVCIVKIRT